MICQKCGKVNVEGTKFCSNCGNNLEIINNQKDMENVSFWTENENDNMLNSEQNKPIQINEEVLNNNMDSVNNKVSNENNESNDSIKINVETNNNEEKIININSDNNLNNIDKDFYGNDFKTKKNIIWKILLIIFIIIIIGIGIGYYFLTKPKNMLMYSLYKYSSKLEKNINKDYYSISGNYNLDFEINDSTGKVQDYLTMYNDLAFSGTYGIDFDKKISTLEFGSTYEDKEFINGNIYNDNNNYYVYLDKVYDKYLTYKLEKPINMYFKENNQDYINVIDGIKKALISIIKDEYLVKTDAEFNNVKVNKVTLNIDKNNYDEICTEFLTTLKDDKKFVNSYKNITNEDIVEIIDEFINNLNDTEYINKININFYIKKVSNELLDIEIDLNNRSDQYVKIIISDKKITLSITDSGNELKITLNILHDSNYSYYQLEIKENELSLKLNLKLTTNYNKTVINKDVTNNIDVKDLTEEEKLNMTVNLSKKEAVVQFNENLISPLLNNTLLSGSLKELKYNEVLEKINNKEDFVLCISQAGCPYCQSYIPKLEQVSNDIKINTYYIDTSSLSNEDMNNLNNKFKYDGTPTTVFFIDGKEIMSDSRIVGDTTVDKIEEKLKQFRFIMVNNEGLFNLLLD